MMERMGVWRETYVGALLLACSKGAFVQCCWCTIPHCREIGDAHIHRGVGGRVVEQQTRYVVFGKQRERILQEIDEIVFRDYVLRSECWAFIGVVLSTLALWSTRRRITHPDERSDPIDLSL